MTAYLGLGMVPGCHTSLSSRKYKVLSNSVVHLDAEELLCQHSFAIKNQLVASKAPYCLLLAGSLWHKGAYTRTCWVF